MSKVICSICNKNVEKNELCASCGSSLILNERYYLIKVMGKDIGVKYLAENKNNEKFIIKSLSVENLDNWADKEHFQREINNLRQLNHENIPKFIESFDENGKLFFVREYIDGVTLEEEMKNKRYTESEIISLMSEIAQILNYLHNLIPPLLYGNLKLPGIIRADNGRIYLTDFSLSGDLDRISEISAYYDFLAPEQMEGRAVIESDYYFLGLMALKLVTRKEPDELKNQNGEFRIRENSGISDSTAELIEGLLHERTKKRIESYNKLFKNTNNASNSYGTEIYDKNENKIVFNKNIFLIPVILILLIAGGIFSMVGKKAMKPRRIGRSFLHTNKTDRFYNIAMGYYNNGQFLSAKINFETSCNQHKNKEACYKVASMYQTGMKMIRKNEQKADEYYKKACKLGKKKACK